MADLALVTAVDTALAKLKKDDGLACNHKQSDGLYHLQRRKKVDGGPHHGTFEWVTEHTFRDVGELAAYLGVRA